MGLTTYHRFLFMRTEEIFKDVMDAVCKVTGLTSEDVVYSRTEECTDARHLLVRYLLKLMPMAKVGELIGRTRQGVSSIMQRQKGDTWLMVRNWEEIVKELASKYYIGKK